MKRLTAEDVGRAIDAALDRARSGTWFDTSMTPANIEGELDLQFVADALNEQLAEQGAVAG
jgi:hypothetical protein